MSIDYAQILKEKIVTDPVLFKHWYDFQFNVEQYLPAERLSQLIPNYPDNVRDILLKNPVTRAKLKSTILQGCNLQEELDYDITSPMLPYVMLSPETIKRLVLILGALVCHSDIAKVIGRKPLEEIVTLIGRDVYMFVVKRSLLFGRKIPELPEQNHNWKLVHRIESCGKRVFEYLIHNLPGSVVDRLNLRTGLEFNGNFPMDEKDLTQSLSLVRYAVANFFGDDEGAKLCLR